VPSQLSRLRLLESPIPDVVESLLDLLLPERTLDFLVDAHVRFIELQMTLERSLALRDRDVPATTLLQLALVREDLPFGRWSILHHWFHKTTDCFRDLWKISCYFGPALLHDVLNKLLVFGVVAKVTRFFNFQRILLLLIKTAISLAFPGLALALTSAFLLFYFGKFFLGNGFSVVLDSRGKAGDFCLRRLLFVVVSDLNL
jgi:hypothetical protein